MLVDNVGYVLSLCRGGEGTTGLRKEIRNLWRRRDRDCKRGMADEAMHLCG